MVTTKIVEIFDLVDSDDPILTCECLLEGVQNRALVGEFRIPDAILSLSSREEVVVVVVR